MKENQSGGIKGFLTFMPAYFAGIFVGICLIIFRVLRIWKITGMENFPTLKEKRKCGLLLVSNHPSLLEPIALVGLFMSWYIIRPHYGPWNIAEITNFRRGFFRLMTSRIIFIDRNKVSSETRAILRANKLLKSGAVVIMFAEGGRTYRGKEGGFLFSENGNKIRKFKNGVGLLAVRTQAVVLPVWVEGTDKVTPNLDNARYSLPRFWKPVRISIGRPRIFESGSSLEQVTREIERAVLDLA